MANRRRVRRRERRVSEGSEEKKEGVRWWDGGADGKKGGRS
jgi:hypothetical protein